MRLLEIQKPGKVKSVKVGEPETARAILAVPLVVQQKIVGVITALGFGTERYTAEDQIFMETLASEAANAFENAHLYQDVMNAAERRAVLYHAGQEIAAAGLDLEKVYHSIHHAISRLMPFDVLTIVLSDENQKALHAVYLMIGASLPHSILNGVRG